MFKTSLNMHKKFHCFSCLGILYAPQWHCALSLCWRNPGCTIFNVTDSQFFPKFLEILDTNWNFINVGYNSVIVGQNQMIWTVKIKGELERNNVQTFHVLVNFMQSRKFVINLLLTELISI